MKKYLCPWDVVGVIEMENFKDCSKTYKYTSKLEYKPETQYNSARLIGFWDSQTYLLKKATLDERYFIIDAKDEDDAMLKRREYVLNYVKKELENYRSKIYNRIESERDLIYSALHEENSYDINLSVTNSQYYNLYKFETKFSLIRSRNAHEETVLLRGTVKEYINKLFEEIKNELNLKTRISLSATEAFINLDNPELNVALTTADTLGISFKNNPYKESIFLSINTNIPRYAFNTITIDDLTYKKYKELKEEFSSRKDEIAFLQVSGNTWHAYTFDMKKYIGSNTRGLSNPLASLLRVYDGIKESKPKIFIKIVDGVFVATEDYIMEYIRIKDGHIYINGKQSYTGSESMIIEELRKQLGRDAFNSLRLISEVDND